MGSAQKKKYAEKALYSLIFFLCVPCLPIEAQLQNG